MKNSRALLAFAFTLASLPALAQNPPAAPPAQPPPAASPAAPASNLDLTVGAAVIIPGTIYVEPYDWETGTGFGFSVALDYAVAPRLSAGLLFQYSSTTLTEVDVGAKTTGVGIALKALFGDPRALHFKAGVNLMYQLNSVDVPEADDSTGLGVGLVLELMKPLSPTADLAGQLGFLTQPSGGNDSAEVTWAPLFFVGAGVTFGL